MATLQHLAREHSGQERRVHLDEVRQVGVDRLVERLLQRRVAPAEGEHPEPGEEVEIAATFVVVEVGALGARVEAVEADRTENPHELGVDVPAVELEVLSLVACQHLIQIETHRLPPSAEGSSV